MINNQLVKLAITFALGLSVSCGHDSSEVANLSPNPKNEIDSADTNKKSIQTENTAFGPVHPDSMDLTLEGGLNENVTYTSPSDPYAPLPKSEYRNSVSCHIYSSSGGALFRFNKELGEEKWGPPSGDPNGRMLLQNGVTIDAQIAPEDLPGRDGQIKRFRFSDFNLIGHEESNFGLSVRREGAALAFNSKRGMPKCSATLELGEELSNGTYYLFNFKCENMKGVDRNNRDKPFPKVTVIGNMKCFMYSKS